ncbi:cytochrome c oxidase subunit I [Pseudobacteriovorax antillogorgiicola]|uniref:Cytochrome c oxidase subunit 1 n=1 Tax=Pseudobacteriovorax antillogorgiicola TaxID=1513793 RepID=A0A1Y6BN87_9BACT|nr:cytochrome c oxidase subunit I [Pseudobacteriovorax antillogorgiicola]TCS53896.1 cytochrome c oxidase subunit 1 [Pseudobacteriovorax antillogorgiicola]SMF20835.1 cytochrome c oxidase subunit 1 [Pseudobacteriovorax antillogorgiicola]
MSSSSSPKTGLWSWITTVDHKRIGIMYALAAFFFLIFGGVEALLMRTQLLVPNNDFITARTFNSMVTMHGTTMIFLFVMPLSAAFFNYLTPIMIGARDVAFPRLNALSFWIFLFGGFLLNFGFLVDQAPRGGWFGYANLTSLQYTPDKSADFWAMGLQVVGLASLIASVNFFVTILNMRCKGMTLLKMPMFIWTTLVTQVLLMLSLPVITVALLMVTFDRQFGTGFFNPADGGQVILWQHLFWVFGHPEVYILILPAMGIVSEILATFSKKPLFGYSVMVYSSCAIGFLGFAVWAHHMFTTGMGPWATTFFTAATMLIAVPTGVKIFNWISTVWGGRISFTTANLFGLSFVAMFTLGGLSGIMHSSAPIDSQHQDTYFVVAHFHYVLYGGAVMALFGGIYYWFPKVTGRYMNEGIGKIQFWLYMIGFNMTFFPMHFLGVQGMPRRNYTYAADQGWDLWNFIVSMGAYLTAVGAILFVINIIWSLRKGAKAPGDCWDGRTLEWTIPSPPHEYNFGIEPTVQRLDDYWFRKYSDDGKKKTLPAEPSYDPKAIHLPNPSFWPIVLAAGITTGAAGFFVSGIGLAISLFGLAVIVVSTYGWIYEEA